MSALQQIPKDATVWEPLPGSQRAYLISPVFETLYSGTRGPGKTFTLLMDFAQEIGKGYGSAWKGIIFRRTYKELADILAKSRELFGLVFPQAKFYESPDKYYWQWPTGERLMFRHFAKPGDYWDYHGHEYPFIAWEELTNWATDEGYLQMMSCCRSTQAGMPRKYRATTNPYGVGHGWIKQRFRLEGCPRNEQMRTPIIKDAVDSSGNPEPHRVTIFGYLRENTILLAADPGYPQRIRASAANPAMADAWLSGSWDIVAGGMFEHTWDRDVHIVSAFMPPNTWRIDRTYDYGWSSPFALLWFAESDGSDYRDSGGKLRSSVRGDLFVWREWYGWSGKPNEGKPLTMAKIAKGIVEREMSWGVWGNVNPGPTDSQFFQIKDGNSLAKEAAKPIRLDDGRVVRIPTMFTRANQAPGTRKKGWAMINEYLDNAKVPEGRFVREKPGLFVMDTCVQTIRTFPSLPRSEKDPDDADSDAEDHLADCIKGRILNTGRQGRSGGRQGG